MAAEQEKQAHYVSRRSPLGPRAEGSPGFEEAENERIERAQAQAERDMYMHMHAHMQRPTPVLAGDRTRAGALVERVEERRKRSEDNDRSNGRNEQQSSERTSSNSGIRPTEEIGNQRNGGLGIISQDEKSQNRSQQEAQLQAAAKYASLASLSSPSILRDATQLQRETEVLFLQPLAKPIKRKYLGSLPPQRRVALRVTSLLQRNTKEGCGVGQKVQKSKSWNRDHRW